VENQKIKKSQDEMTLQLVRNPDIVSAVAANKYRPYTVGFAAETNNVVAYAREKMQLKGLDMMVANDVSNQTIGFNSDNNAVTVLWRDGEKILELASKASIAQHIVHLIAHQTRKNN
jgi:phosphopantothenoylcysteine decarboxylase/phosphopantothenate--cysteine ligase